MQVLKIIFVLLEVVVLFNLLILVHELGHFLAARWRGLKIDRFGIWFGKPIWQKKIGDVTYCLGSIPAGGYVALPQMAPMEAIEGKNEGGDAPLPPISPTDKIIVALAGPVFSFLLALVMAVVVWGIGRPVSGMETTTVVGYVKKDSPAERAGVRPGDRLLAVDGAPVSKFRGVGKDSVTWRIVRSEGETLPLLVERDGRQVELEARPARAKSKGWWERRPLRTIGISPEAKSMVDGMVANSPALKAGLRTNDLIVRVNGQALHHPGAFEEMAEQGGALELVVRRDGREVPLTLVPEVPVQGGKKPEAGIFWGDPSEPRLVRQPPFEQVRAAIDSMVETFSSIFSRKSDIGAQHLSGPVGILRIYYLLFQSDQGWRLALWFSVVLNVNLALLNMLPIPVLDGGHIVLAIVEKIFRRPISPWFLNWVQTGCALLVIGYILFVSFYDVQDLRPGKSEPHQEMKFAPASATPKP